MKNSSLLRQTHIQNIRDLADDADTTDVALAAETGRLQLEIQLALQGTRIDSDALQALTRARLRCMHIIEVLALGRIDEAHAAIEAVRETLATFGDRPTEPPPVRHVSAMNAAAASPP